MRALRIRAHRSPSARQESRTADEISLRFAEQKILHVGGKSTDSELHRARRSIEGHCLGRTDRPIITNALIEPPGGDRFEFARPDEFEPGRSKELLNRRGRKVA